MEKGPDWAAASAWQRLTERWEAAAAAYDELYRVRAEAAGSSAVNDDLDASVEAARKLLDDLQLQMDQMVRTLAARRTAIGDEVILASVTPPGGGEPEDDPESER